MASPATELCRLEGIRMRYGAEEVLRGLDLSLPRGGILGLVGENGSGKSTLLKILAGILRPEAGVLRAPAGRPRVGYMPENCQWYPHLSGAQVLDYFARFTGSDPEERRRALKRVGLWEARDKRLAAYSKGMRQKLGLAGAMGGAPDLLVLDEPTNGLDPRGIIDFYAVLAQSVAAGSTVVLSSHLLSELEGRITHIAFLHGGRVVASGACADLIARAGLDHRAELQGPEELLRALEGLARARAWRSSRRAGRLELGLGFGELPRLLQELASAPPLQVNIKPPSLEDLYLHQMGRPAPFGANGRAAAPSLVAETP